MTTLTLTAEEMTDVLHALRELAAAKNRDAARARRGADASPLAAANFQAEANRASLLASKIGDARQPECAPCAALYGDGGPCDEGKPLASPHRRRAAV